MNGINYPLLIKRIRSELIITQTELTETLGLTFASVNCREKIMINLWLSRNEK